ncbi:MAG: prepilin-type N-terminal cleavage/methylation domain-containing protein [Myxococcales bacterium]|nr:prepilin-type N-terminal cleavage/methylation domain-containing protein [Myxococcales bacterium]
MSVHRSTQQPRSRRSPRRAAGFTLVEMMVALTAGAIAITSIYYVSAASSQHFQEQQLVANMQTAVRLAAERIRADFQRAGFLGSVNPRFNGEGAECAGDFVSSGAPNDYVQGFWLQDGAMTSLLDQQGTNEVQADEVRLVGNYATADEYVAEVLPASQLRIDVNNPAFRRSFGTSGHAADYKDAVLAVFGGGKDPDTAPVRIVRVRTSHGRILLAKLTAVSEGSGTGPILTLDTSNVNTDACFKTTEWVTVAPLMRIQYAVGSWQSASGSKFAGSTPLVGQQAGTVGSVTSQAPALIRREITFDAEKTPVDGTGNADATAQVVLEYLAEFNVDLFVDTRANDSLPPSVVRADDPAVDWTLDSNTNTNDADARNSNSMSTVGPQRIRSVQLRLSTRSPSEDARFTFVARGGSTAPLLRYELDPGVAGAARVRTIQTEIFLPNFSYKGRLNQ